MSEHELVLALRRGEVPALEELIRQYTPCVSAVLARVLPRRQADWEELAADVFLAAWEHRDRLEAGRLKGWLCTVARNRAVDLLRADRDSLPLEDDALILAGDSPQQALEEQELTQLLREALSTLGERPRELFIRHYYYGQTVAEAAGAMDLNLSTAKTWLRRGRQALRDYLSEEGYSYGS